MSKINKDFKYEVINNLLSVVVMVSAIFFNSYLLASIFVIGRIFTLMQNKKFDKYPNVLKIRQPLQIFVLIIFLLILIVRISFIFA